MKILKKNWKQKFRDQIVVFYFLINKKFSFTNSFSTLAFNVVYPDDRQLLKTLNKNEEDVQIEKSKKYSRNLSNFIPAYEVIHGQLHSGVVDDHVGARKAQREVLRQHRTALAGHNCQIHHQESVNYWQEIGSSSPHQ